MVEMVEMADTAARRLGGGARGKARGKAPERARARAAAREKGKAGAAVELRGKGKAGAASVGIEAGGTWVTGRQKRRLRCASRFGRRSLLSLLAYGS